MIAPVAGSAGGARSASEGGTPPVAGYFKHALARASGSDSRHAAGVSATATLAGALVTIRRSRQHLFFDKGRVSMISTVSPACVSFFSSCTKQTVRFLMNLPYRG